MGKLYVRIWNQNILYLSRVLLQILTSTWKAWMYYFEKYWKTFGQDLQVLSAPLEFLGQLLVNPGWDSYS